MRKTKELRSLNSLANRICLGVEENPNCHQELHKNSRKININPRVILKDIAKSFDIMGISVSTCGDWRRSRASCVAI